MVKSWPRNRGLLHPSMKLFLWQNIYSVLVSELKCVSGPQGITEVEPDVFYVAARNITFNETFATIPESCGLAGG